MDVDARLEAVEAENDLLRARIAQLEGLLGFTIVAPLSFGLTPGEASVFGALMKRDLMTKETAMAAIYRDLGRDEAEIKIVDVFVCKMRKKLKPFDIIVETVWGHGYRIAPQVKDRVRSLFAAEGIAVP